MVGSFFNTMHGIEGAIVLSIGHGLVSPALFYIVGSVIYDRSDSRVIRVLPRSYTIYASSHAILLPIHTGKCWYSRISVHGGLTGQMTGAATGPCLEVTSCRHLPRTTGAQIARRVKRP